VSGVEDDNTLHTSLAEVTKLPTEEARVNSGQTLCRRHFLYKLLRHGNHLLLYPAVFHYYAKIVGWDADKVLRHWRTETRKSTFHLRQAALNEFGYIPATVQIALTGHRVLHNQPGQEGRLYFPNQDARDLDSERAPLTDPWLPTRRPTVPIMRIPTVSLTQYIAGF